MKVFTYASLATYQILVGRKKIIIIKKVLLWAFTLISIIQSHKHSVWAPCRVQSHASCALLGIFLSLVTLACPRHTVQLCVHVIRQKQICVFILNKVCFIVLQPCYLLWIQTARFKNSVFEFFVKLYFSPSHSGKVSESLRVFLNATSSTL